MSTVSRRPLLVALRALGLGDLLVAVPALRALHRAFPEHRRLLAIPAWLHPLRPLIGGWDEELAMPGLYGTWPSWLLGLPRSVETVAVNLHGNGAESAGLLDQLSPTRRIGHHRPGWPGPDWVEQMPERRRWCRMLIAHGVPADEHDLRLRPVPDKLAGVPGAILVHPGAAFGAKRWPVARFAEVATHYRAEGRPVLVTGGTEDRERAEQVARLARLPDEAVRAGRTGIRELAALVSSGGLVISGDTGIAHLAVAFGVPTVTLFGPADPDRWGPPPGPHRVLQGPGRRGDLFAAEPDPALLAITVAQVLAAGSSLLRH